MENLIHQISTLILKDLGKSPLEDIISILKGTRQLFKSRLAIYNKFNNDYSRLTTYTSEMEDLKGISDDSPGHICTDVALENMGEPKLIVNLESTPYYATDKAVKLFNLKTYLGIPVRVNTKIKGVFSVVFDTERAFSESELRVMHNLCTIIGLEEKILE